MTKISEGLAIWVLGPLVGVEFAVAAFLNPILGRLPEREFRRMRGDSARVLGKVMPFWYVASLLLLVATAIAAQNRLIGMAAGLMTVVQVFTLIALVPVNNRIAAWSAGEPDDGVPSRAQAARWDRLHRLRVVLLTVVFAALTIACFR